MVSPRKRVFHERSWLDFQVRMETGYFPTTMAVFKNQHILRFLKFAVLNV